MKKVLIKSVVVAFSTLLLCSFVSKKTEAIKSGDPGDETVTLLEGQTAKATDGTYIPPQSTTNRIVICPGTGAKCQGSCTIGGVVYSYDSSKGILRPDIIINSTD